MSGKNLSTDSYKGVRDFYPKDASIQMYIFETWSKTAESFGFERYDASILEPSELYKNKGVENEELVNEQTYTFTDRGEREVTLRPEMTPTVARMVSAKQRELSFPLRWYSIPNLFRYERPQRGRLREHWQLNCDIFGIKDVTADLEIIALAHQTMIAFGATPDMFEILLNDRKEMGALYESIGITDQTLVSAITRLTDRKNKISVEEYRAGLQTILGDGSLVDNIIGIIEDTSSTSQLCKDLHNLGIENVRIDRTIARGFDYYTSTVFELVDTHPDNNRSMLGGGRYDNLTAMFDGEAIPGVGFGMGDVTMLDFLETHKLIPEHIRITAPKVMVIPTDTKYNVYAEGIAMKVRQAGHKVTTDISDRKLSKKIGNAKDRGCKYVIVIGEEEIKTEKLTVKNLHSTESISTKIDELINVFAE